MQTYMCATLKAAGEKFSGEPSAREGGRPVGAGSVTQALDQTLAMSRAHPPGSAVGARASTHPVGPLCPRHRTYSSLILMLTGFRRKKSTPRHKSWPWGRGSKESADNNVWHRKFFFFFVNWGRARPIPIACSLKSNDATPSSIEPDMA